MSARDYGHPVLDDVAMTDRPILFSSPMVRAILEGTKTQTRRVVNVARVQKKGTRDSAGWRPFNLDDAADRRAVETNCGRVCPYGEIGDRLWVRETWAAPHECDAMPPRAIPVGTRITYAATADLGGPRGVGGLIGRPSIFMPRSACRITLAVESVRVERLNAITEADATAEGVDTGNGAVSRGWARCNFAELWDEINGKRAPWETDPWVWVVTFQRVQP